MADRMRPQAWFVCVYFYTDRASTIPSNTVCAVANPVRGLLDRKISEEHRTTLERRHENENKKKKKS